MRGERWGHQERWVAAGRGPQRTRRAEAASLLLPQGSHRQAGSDRARAEGPWGAVLASRPWARWVGAEKGKVRTLAQGSARTTVLRPRNRVCLFPFGERSLSSLLSIPPVLPGNPCCPRPTVSPTGTAHPIL